MTFDRKGTWSQKYNLVWDSVLQLNIFPPEIAGREIAYYLTRQNEFGLPLDSRKSYTKSDWIIWTASMARSPDDFQALIHPVYRFVNEGADRVPLSDWHETTNGKVVGFRARSVVGGYFMKVLADQWSAAGQLDCLPQCAGEPACLTEAAPDGSMWCGTQPVNIA